MKVTLELGFEALVKICQVKKKIEEGHSRMKRKQVQRWGVQDIGTEKDCVE